MIGSWGGIDFPLDAADYTDTFAPADPARETMLGMFAAAINAELGAVWTKVTATLRANHELKTTDPVEDTLALAPTHQVMQQRKADFPLLALHRVETATYSDVGQDRSRAQPWHLHYILGPLEVGSARKLLDACLLVAGIVDCVTEQRYHEAYLGGAIQFGPGGPLNSVHVTKSEGPGQSLYGGDEGSGTIYWGIVITLDTVEIGGDTTSDGDSGDPPLDGATYEAGVFADGELLPDVAVVDTDSILE